MSKVVRSLHARGGKDFSHQNLKKRCGKELGGALAARKEWRGGGWRMTWVSLRNKHTHTCVYLACFSFKEK